MPSGTTLLAIVVGFLAAVVGAIYVFGIPNEWKKVMEEKALETMGENKASYMMKDSISRLPGSDQKDVKNLQTGIGNAAGGLLQNPLGKQAGNAGDDLTSPLTGR